MHHSNNAKLEAWDNGKSGLITMAGWLLNSVNLLRLHFFLYNLYGLPHFYLTFN
jgi:hypothetical protein